jgi:hypothetical protein
VPRWARASSGAHRSGSSSATWPSKTSKSRSRSRLPRCGRRRPSPAGQPDLQVDNTRARRELMEQFTRVDLDQWMLGQLLSLNVSSCQLAYDLASQRDGPPSARWRCRARCSSSSGRSGPLELVALTKTAGWRPTDAASALK